MELAALPFAEHRGQCLKSPLIWITVARPFHLSQPWQLGLNSGPSNAVPTALLSPTLAIITSSHASQWAIQANFHLNIAAPTGKEVQRVRSMESAKGQDTGMCVLFQMQHAPTIGREIWHLLGHFQIFVTVGFPQSQTLQQVACSHSDASQCKLVRTSPKVLHKIIVASALDP